MNKYLRFAIALCLMLALCLTGCKKENNNSDKQTAATTQTIQTATYEVKVSTRAGLCLEGVQVYLYADGEATELLDMQSTDEMGYAVFIVPVAEGMVAKLQNVPEGYDCPKDACYPILGELTEIVLAPKTIGDEPVDPFNLSDVMPDFKVVTMDGKEQIFSELMGQKDAMVLLFWSPENKDIAEELLLWQEALKDEASFNRRKTSSSPKKPSISSMGS